MNTLTIIILTLLIYSIIPTILYIITGERNEDILICFGFGIFGLTLLLLCKTTRSIYKHIKNNTQRSIFKDESGALYKCKLKYTNNLMWNSSYKIVKRYASKSEWTNLPDVPTNIIEESKKNCDNCKYDKECVCEFPYNKVKCKHDNFGKVIEFDKFKEK